MDLLCVSLFREFSATYNDRPVECLGSRKVQELLGYLLLHRHRPHLREMLTTLLWTEIAAPQARKYFRQTLWRLQEGLHDQTALESARFLDVGTEWIQLDPAAPIWFDVDQFERRYALCQGTAGQDLTEHQLQAVRDAIDLYRGDLLENWYQDWCLFERERLQNILLILLDKLLDYCIAHQLSELGLEYGTLALRQDSTREKTYRRLMRLSYLAGDRTTALRLYHRCVEILMDELGVEPADRTARLYRAICEDRGIDFVIPPAPDPQTPRPDTAPAPDLLTYLRTVRGTLKEAQAQMQRGIELVEHYLGTQR